MVTGGIRRRPVVDEVLDSGVAMVGMATALAIDPALPRKWRLGHNSQPQLQPVRWKLEPLAALASMAMVKFQLRRLSKGRRPKPNVSPLRAFLVDQVRSAIRTRSYRRLMAAR